MDEALETARKTNSRASDAGNLLHKASSICVYLLVVLVPLAISPFAYEQAMAAKPFILGLLAAVALLCWSVGSIIGGFRVRWSRLYWPIGAYLIFSAVSTAISIRPATSLFGRDGRYEGLIGMLVCAAIFFLAVQYLSKEDAPPRLAKALVGAAALVSVYGIGQFFGLDPVSWGAAGFEKTRVFSTLGNPIILGGYLSVALTIATGLLISARRHGETALYGSAMLAILSALALTLSRGAWLAAIIGVVLATVLSAREPGYRRRCLVMAAVICGVLVLGACSVLLARGETALTMRLASIANPLGGSGESRVEIWKSALAMIGERPFFGYGPDAFRLAFPAHETLASARFFPVALADNAHNIILQTAATVGLPALVALLTAYALFFVEFFKKRRSPVATAAGAGVLAYLVQALLSVNVAATSFLPWLLMGCVLASGARESRPAVSAALRVGAATVCVFALILAAQSTFFFVADIQMGQGVLALGSGNLSAGLGKLESAAVLNPWSDLYVRERAGGLQTAARTNDDRVSYDASLKAMDEALKLNPDDIDNYVMLGDFYIYGGETFDPALYDSAIDILTRAVEMRKYSPQAHRILGFARLRRGQTSQALEELDAALNVDPRDARALLYKGECMERLGEPTRAAQAYREALKIRPDLAKAEQALERLDRKTN